MGFEPAPGNRVAGGQRVELPPQILILHRLFRGSFPAARLPAFEPFADAFAEILRIGEEFHLAGFGQGPQCFDGGLHFHPVVGGGKNSAAQLADAPLGFEDCGPTAGAGVGLAPAVGVNRDVLHRAANVEAHTSFFRRASSASFLTSSLIFCACDLCASRTASSVWTRMESRRPTTAMGVRRSLLRAS